jgi:hypothetical protein
VASEDEDVVLLDPLRLHAWQHLKRRSMYVELRHPGVVFYLALDGTGAVWWRPSAEFHDGRFRLVDHDIAVTSTGIRRG